MNALLRRFLNWLLPKKLTPDEIKENIDDIIIAYDDVDLRVFVKPKSKGS